MEANAMVSSINVLIDDYADMNMRSKFVLDGIHEAASQKKIPVQTFFSTSALLKALSGNRKKFVIVIAETKMRS
jgi:predicted transcriptional regulator